MNNAREEYSPQKLPHYTTPEKIQHSPGVEPPLNSRTQTPIAISRSMTHGEIIQEYKRTFFANLKIYHPLISALTTKFTNAEFNKHLSLPKRVCYVLSLSWILHTLTFPSLSKIWARNLQTHHYARTPVLLLFCSFATRRILLTTLAAVFHCSSQLSQPLLQPFWYFS